MVAATLDEVEEGEGMQHQGCSTSGTGACSWTGREGEIARLRWLLGESADDVAPPLLIHGPETTGKTAIVRAVLADLARPFAYTSARDCATPKNLLNSLVEQLVRCGWLAQSDHVPCDRAADLLTLLKGARGQPAAVAADTDDNDRGDDPPRAANASSGNATAYWVIDDAETLTESSEGVKFATFLVQLRHFLSASAGAGQSAGAGLLNRRRPRQLCVILVSRVSFESFHQGSSYEESEPTSIFFAAYTVAQLQDILLRDHQQQEEQRGEEEDGESPRSPKPSLEQWRRFLGILVPAMSQYTSSIHMLRYLCFKMAPLFFGSASDNGAQGGAEAADKADAYLAFKPKLQRVIRHMRSNGMSNVTLSEFFERDEAGEKGSGKRSRDNGAQAGAEAAVGAASGQVSGSNFAKHLPYMGKLLLLAAYVAGWNPATSDNRLFGRARTQKRRRKDPLLMNKKAQKIQEAKLLGPGTFTVERLLQILKALYKFEGDYFGDPELAHRELESNPKDEDRYLSRKVHCQETYQLVKTFTRASLFSPASCSSSGEMSKSGGGGGGGGGRLDLSGESYRLQCNLKEQAAFKVAKSLGITLSDYLVYA